MNMHLHKPNWHLIGVRMEHLLHDPRFWAAMALVILFTLMVLASIFSKTAHHMNTTPIMPTYPYMP